MKHKDFELKTFGDATDQNELTAAEKAELESLGFEINTVDGLDPQARYQLYDLEPYYDYAKNYTSGAVLRHLWNAFLTPRGTVHYWSKDRSKLLVDMYFTDNESDRIPLFDIFCRFNAHVGITSRGTRLASTFIEFLGTNAGASYLREAKEWSETLSNAFQHESLPKKDKSNIKDRIPEAYADAWRTFNDRVLSTNEGTSHRDSLLGYIGKDPIAYDMEVLDTITRWLGTESGQAFLQRYEHERRIALDVERRMRTGDFDAYLPTTAG